MRKLRALLTHLNEVYATKTHSVSNVSHTYAHTSTHKFVTYPSPQK